MAGVERVFIDTSELFPYTIMDVLLTLSEDRLFDWMWTDELLDEWQRVIVREKHRTPESARSVTDAVRTWFASTRLDPATYRGRVSEHLSPDEDDRVHIAACLDGRVDVLVTRNTGDFSTEQLGRHGVSVRTPADEYLVGLLRRRPTAVQQSIVRLASHRTRPSITPCELVERISRAGAVSFARRLHRGLGCG